MTILAFMQNMWVRHPERVKAMIAKDGEELRLRLIEYSLFAGCVSGRRLKTAFGAELCDAIIWEESTREIAGDPKTIFPPDHEHMVECIRTHKPGVIVTFGTIARDALMFVEANHGALFDEVMTLAVPHPAARQADVPERLKQAGETMRRLMEVAA